MELYLRLVTALVIGITFGMITFAMPAPQKPAVPTVQQVKMYADQYNNKFDSLTIPTIPQNPTPTLYQAYQNALTTYKNQLQPFLTTFLNAARLYTDAIRPSHQTIAQLIDALIKYEQALFDVVTTPPNKGLDLAWDTAANQYIAALMQQGDMSEAKNIANEVYGEVAQAYYYPNLYADKVTAQQLALKHHGEDAYLFFYPQIFTDNIRARNVALKLYGPAQAKLYYPNFFK